ncbi:T6SS phospholipase effector Tle1-like catalytic domain-containing protein [Sporobolomyces salmoneus]|uniref:T6SS phospholipase effector Tle1-like catalytic domain-containing protein n=1 Tax=Sporobolomyces salmoneus TaxID=183962 RepID=UPI0031770DBD
MKRLIILCDGTLEDADSEQETRLYTNIGRLPRAIKEEDKRNGTEIEQIKLYLGGVGTEDGKVGGLVSGALGTGIMDSVRNIYSFLGLNWESGDEIFLFGFSRGAYTVRLVASLISVIGILHPRKTMHLFPALFEALDQRTGDSPKEAFKSAKTIQKLLASYSSEKREQDLEYARKGKFLIKFVGLFDTVATRGRPSTLRRSPSQEPPAIKFDSFGFDETRLETCIEHAVQALPLDEFRVDYVPALWVSNPLGRPKGQYLEQTWFSGAHADVGGGYMDGDLGYLSLWWMCDKVKGMLEIDMEFLRNKMCNETAEGYGKMPPHKSRVGQFLLAKSVERPVPLTINTSTNEFIHASIRYQPPSQLRPIVSALFSNPDLFTTLSPFEQELKDHWPVPYFSIRSKEEKKKRRKKKTEEEKQSLSDTEVDEKGNSADSLSSSTVKPDYSIHSPPPSPALTSLSDEEKEKPLLLSPSERPLSTASTQVRSDFLSTRSDSEDPDWYDDNYSAQNFRETSQRLFPSTNERRHLLPQPGNPFRAMRRKVEEWEDKWSRRQERKEEQEEWKEIEKQMKRERRTSRE